MLTWIKANPIYAGIILAVALALVAGFFVYLDKQNQRHEGQLINQGATQERSEENAKTINTLGIAKNAVDHPSSEQLNSLCSRYDRNCPKHP